jgi:ParB-like chromosome segregation protein Spo0J
MTDRQLVVTYLDPKRVKPSPHNAMKHSPEQIEQLAASMKAFGFTQPLLIDEKRMLIAGHGRLKAAMSLNLDRVPTITLAGLTPQKKRALMLADNRIPRNAEWDEKRLARELRALDGADMDLKELGFSAGELDRILEAVDGKDQGNVEYRESYSVIVEVPNEKSQAGLLKRLIKEGYKCRALVS